MLLLVFVQTFPSPCQDSQLTTVSLCGLVHVEAILLIVVFIE